MIEKYNIQNIPAFIHLLKRNCDYHSVNEIIDLYNEFFKHLTFDPIIGNEDVLYEFKDCLIIRSLNCTYMIYFAQGELISAVNRYTYLKSSDIILNNGLIMKM